MSSPFSNTFRPNPRLNLKSYLLCFFAIVVFMSSYGQITPGVDKIMRLDKDICTYHPEDPNAITAAQLRSIAEQSTSRTPCSVFNVNYNGFTPEAEAAFEYALNIWASIIDSPIPITVNANFAPLGTGVLGNASSNFFFTISGAGVPDTFYPRALAEQLIGQEIVLPQEGNQNPSVDINCNFNSNRSDWYYGTDGNVPNNQFDFVTVVLHEIGHGLGFVGFGSVNNATGIGSIRDGGSGFPSIFDRFITDALGGSVLNYPDPSVTLGSILTNGTVQPLQNNAPAAVAANNNANPKMFSPNPFQPGSSYSHWDLGNFPVDSPLMRPSLTNGLSIHDPGPVTNAFFEEMGWNLCASLSTSEFSDTEFSVSPIPFKNHIDITVSNTSLRRIELTLYDITGKVIIHTTQSPADGKIRLTNLDRIENAIYFLKIKDSESNREITRKLIKH